MKIVSFSPKQLRVLTWWCQSSTTKDLDAIICDGAVRSGKTLCTCISFICWAMHSYNGTQFALCGKTIVSLRRNVIASLLPVMRSLGFVCTDKLSANRIEISFGGKCNSFYLFGGKDEGSSALIQGSTFGGVLFDEVALMPRSFVEQAIARCSLVGSKLWFNCNPEGPYHWFYREWITHAEERRALYLHFTMSDNPSLSKRVVQRYERLYSGIFYRRFVLGEWVTTEGRIYDFFDESFIRDVPTGNFDSYAVSCDYGTANPASFGLWGKQDGVWYRLREYYYDSRSTGVQKTDAEYLDDLLGFIGELPVYDIVVDPSAASFIEALRRAGLPVRRANNDVLSGIRLCADLLKTGRIVICRGCTDAIREFALYSWNEGVSGTDSPRKEFDHAMDEIRYFAATIADGGTDDFAITYVERCVTALDNSLPTA